MTICGTEKEINKVLKMLSPAYPDLHLGSAGDVSTYYLGGVTVMIVLNKEAEE